MGFEKQVVSLPNGFEDRNENFYFWRPFAQAWFKWSGLIVGPGGCQFLITCQRFDIKGMPR